MHFKALNAAKLVAAFNTQYFSETELHKTIYNLTGTSRQRGTHIVQKLVFEHTY